MATQRQLLSLEQDEETEQARDLIHGQSGIVHFFIKFRSGSLH